MATSQGTRLAAPCLLVAAFAHCQNQWASVGLQAPGKHRKVTRLSYRQQICLARLAGLEHPPAGESPLQFDLQASAMPTSPWLTLQGVMASELALNFCLHLSV